MNAKTARKERSHEAILAAAARLLRRRGVAGAKVADVMQGAGLTIGGFYAHFASKEALVDETLRRTAAELRERMFRDLDRKPAADRGEVVLKRYLSAAHRDDELDGCPMPAVVGEIGSSAPEYGPLLHEQVARMTDDLAELLPSPKPRQVALALVALMYGGLSLSRALRGTELSDEILRACRVIGASAARAT